MGSMTAIYYDIPTFDRNDPFRLPIQDENGREVIVLEYPQATFGETLKFQEETSKDIDGWFIKFCERFGIHDKKKEGHEAERVIAKIALQIADRIEETRHKQRKSIYTNVDTEPDLTLRKSIFGADIRYICEHYNVGMNTILNEFSYEQIGWMNDGVQFHANEHTDKGKLVNDRMIIERDGTLLRSKDQEIVDEVKRQRTQKHKVIGLSVVKK